MARTAKKETALTAEEKLAQALVPDAEQPYQVPENWCWTYIHAGFDVTSSKRVHKEDWLSEGIPFYRTRELVKLSENGYVDNELFISEELYNECKENYGVPSIGDLLISGVGTIGVPFVVNSEEPFYFKDGNVIWFKNKGLFLSQYIYYLYKSTFIYNQIHDMSAGTTVDTYTIINAIKTVVPLPPLAEQQRIVDRIESLFAKLDEAKEKAQAVVDGFVDRKAAILHKAFTGVLTAGWREDNSISDSSWDKKRIDQISHPRAGYAFDSKKFTDHGFQIVRMGNLYGGSLDLSRSPVFISPEDIEEKAMNRSLINDGDILITLTGTKYKRDYGYAVCVRGQKDLLVNQRILCLPPKETVITNYLLYYLQSNIFRDIFFSNETGGVNQGNVSSKFVEGIEIALPPIKEQQKIVEILDRVFEKETIALEAAEQVIDQIDTMKKAILARAFRGELGTNDPADESAEELLKRVLEMDDK